MKKVAVVGAAGRMGRTVCEAVNSADDMELVAQLDAGDPITAHNLNGAEVAVEFTVPTVSEDNVHALLKAGVNVVVGTTGWTAEKHARAQKTAKETGKNVLIASNFGLSAVFTMLFAEKAAPYFESVEIIELHHPDKVDAPSGTAATTAVAVVEARKNAGVPASPDATELDPKGARGANLDGVHVHAVRLRGLNAHEEVLLGNPGEQLVIRQDSFNRESFMPGVLLAVRQIEDYPGLTIGLDKMMDI
ncbi:4-hydroxy-tetrahydrodipicolinate reductase [Actinotignum urinale]|uniref:4-hydroxy-tetrahydrodipicolinate reductase n=1 Tax=Actinotignum urinale TaxID=190146 RepID=A0AAW9HV82_9ACTO|nr:4-hydroxy-tetrahydrodipicolinate reductase [Actinotignum urinale]MDY5129156.1 4-hydroxy-tetrahydrodipicolinate reductase [Actinotignum urinale]MDY5132343.1 4-hydroxy-tetrahydrodipicolinate reductase [Actinotignum urinale]MDY5151450.1 4-hydroxy-tetrahydrodipicolinate reductase [Actinotignum urinale]MDY5154973.1 4-hydroxy-tetrahydrodipicolinate reductase [Actinotignum urinale]MDY5160772.1 4-hydroxy-tetrahydrodipicolinate reductase [Actinotignum urinale]